MGYTRDAVNGISWLGSYRIVTRVISFSRTAIVARILSPADFGVFGIASMVLSLVEIFTETGINIFLIQQKDKANLYISTAWIVSILRGFIISSLIIISAPIISTFFNSPNAQNSLLLMSLVPMIRGFINPSIVSFIKDLEFKKEFYYRTLIFFVESLVTLLFVYMYRDPLALVLGLIVGAMVEVAISFIMARPYPTFVFQKEKFLQIIGYGKWLTFAGIFEYLYQNIDNIVVGRMLGVQFLGLYSMAYKISSVPISEFSDVFSRATFPVYAKIADDKERLVNAFYKSLVVTSLLVFPIGIFFLVFPDLIIRIFLGEQWLHAAPILQVLALCGVLRSVSNLGTGFFYSVHKQDLVTRIKLVSLLGVSIPIIPLVLLYGMNGAAIAALLGTIATFPISLYYFFRYVRSEI